MKLGTKTKLMLRAQEIQSAKGYKEFFVALLETMKWVH